MLNRISIPLKSYENYKHFQMLIWRHVIMTWITCFQTDMSYTSWRMKKCWSTMLHGVWNNFYCTLVLIHWQYVYIHITFYMCRYSSVGRASDWRSEGPWFDPEWRQFFFVMSIWIFFRTILSLQNRCHCNVSFLLGDSKWNALV